MKLEPHRVGREKKKTHQMTRLSPSLIHSLLARPAFGPRPVRRDGSCW